MTNRSEKPRATGLAFSSVNHSGQIQPVLRPLTPSHNTADNCFKEFSYAESAHGSTKMLPVVMEPRMRQNKLWTGLLGMHLGRSLYVNFTDDAQLDLAVRDAQVNILGWIDKQLGTKFRDILPSEKR